jgi:GDP-4-dehydro-6-deoxy-D-mannose reductase
VNGSLSRRPVLITGATGFAGGHLIEHLASTADIVGWGRSAPRAELAHLAVWQTIDLLHRDQVRAAIALLRPEAVYHLAGAPLVAESWQDAAKPLEANVLATAHLFDAIRRARVECRVVLTGSAAVYAASDTPITEHGPLAPASPYALSKLAQEQLALLAFKDDGLKVIIVRPFNHTGPRQTPAFAAPSMARQIALIERGVLEPVIRVGNLEARRDLSDVRDVVRAYTALMDFGQPGEIYNVGSGVGRSMRSVLDAILSRSKVPVGVETDPARLRPSETPALVADCTRLREATGWQPQVSFDQMLDDLLEYWREQVKRSKFELEK